MNYFDYVDFNCKRITVLGVSGESDFVRALKAELQGRAEVFAPDNESRAFKVHTESEIAAYKAEGMLIGVVDIGVAEKMPREVVENHIDFCKINDIIDDELIYTVMLAKVITERERYDLLYINNVNSEAKRLFARETAKKCAAVSSMGIKLINTDSGYVETLIRA